MNLRLEKRLAPRRNTMIAAVVAFDGGATRMDCVIRNLSDTGAKLQLASVGAVPKHFDLLVPGHVPQKCRVVWRALKELGIEFVVS
ncbi:MAG: PilZ domain-containing protein [Devosia sp.]